MKLSSLFSPGWKSSDESKRKKALLKLKEEKPQEFFEILFTPGISPEIIGDAFAMISSDDRDQIVSCIEARHSSEHEMLKRLIMLLDDKRSLKRLVFSNVGIPVKQHAFARWIEIYPLEPGDLSRFFPDPEYIDSPSKKRDFEMAEYMAGVLSREEDIDSLLSRLQPHFKPHYQAFERGIEKLKSPALIIKHSSFLLKVKPNDGISESAAAAMEKLPEETREALLLDANTAPSIRIHWLRKSDAAGRKAALTNGKFGAKPRIEAFQLLTSKNQLSPEEIVACLDDRDPEFKEYIWNFLGAEFIREHGLTEAFAEFICSAADRGNSILSRLEQIIRELGIAFTKESRSIETRCQYCDGAGEVPQHTDVGFGTNPCHHCSGLGKVFSKEWRYKAAFEQGIPK